MQHWVQVFRDILDEDSFLPVQVIITYFYNGNLYLVPFPILTNHVLYRLQHNRNMMTFLIYSHITTKNCRKQNFPKNFHFQIWYQRFINKLKNLFMPV